MSRHFFRPLRWPPGIRVQLMFWYTGAFAVLIPVCGLLLYFNVQDSLLTSLDTTLAARAQQLAPGITEHRDGIRIDATASPLPGLPFKSPLAGAIPQTASTGPWIRLLDTHGHVVSMTTAFQGVVSPSLSLTQPLRGTPWHGTVSSATGLTLRLYSQALSRDNKPFAILQVGGSLADVTQTLGRIIEYLLVIGLAVLCSSAIGSYVLASRALAPIAYLTRTAQAIKGGDLHQRVPVPRAQDEVHSLAVTLNEMLAYLDEAMTRQQRFVADASHELRTPVAAIQSQADLVLLRVPGAPDSGDALRAIRLEAGRLSRLISDLLALAHGDEGQARFERERVRLDILVTMVAANASPLAIEHHIALQVEAGEPVTLWGDEARLIQVIMNLLDNALHYTDAGGQVTLSVGARGGQVSLCVRDTGRGIAPEHLPHIFERFYRGDRAHTQREDGQSGLGLSIVAWVVQAHGGEVTVESQVGKGSSFLVTLPMDRTSTTSRKS